MQTYPTSFQLQPNQEPQTVYLNFTIPYVCPNPDRTRCRTIAVELYLQNNYKPMCKLSKLAGSISGDPLSLPGCRSLIKSVQPGEPMEQTVQFQIETAVTGLYTGANYLMTANFKFPSRVRDHPKWQNVMAPPVPVSSILISYIISNLLLKHIYFAQSSKLKEKITE